MQKYLLDKYDIDDEKFTMIRKYIVDYFNINTIIISKDGSVDTIFSQKDNDMFFKEKPTVLLYYDNKRYSIICNNLDISPCLPHPVAENFL